MKYFIDLEGDGGIAGGIKGLLENVPDDIMLVNIADKVIVIRRMRVLRVTFTAIIITFTLPFNKAYLFNSNTIHVLKSCKKDDY